MKEIFIYVLLVLGPQPYSLGQFNSFSACMTALSQYRQPAYRNGIRQPTPNLACRQQRIAVYANP